MSNIDWNPGSSLRLKIQYVANLKEKGMTLDNIAKEIHQSRRYVVMMLKWFREKGKDLI